MTPHPIPASRHHPCPHSPSLCLPACQLSSEFREVVGHATLVIAWFLAHPEAHEKLKKKTELLLGKAGALNLPSPARWGTMADALTSLLEVSTGIRYMQSVPSLWGERV